jgi:hypothetical protein
MRPWGRAGLTTDGPTATGGLTSSRAANGGPCPADQPAHAPLHAEPATPPRLKLAFCATPAQQRSLALCRAVHPSPHCTRPPLDPALAGFVIFGSDCSHFNFILPPGPRCEERREEHCPAQHALRGDAAQASPIISGAAGQIRVRSDSSRAAIPMSQLVAAQISV